MARALLSLIALAGLAAGAIHFAGYRKRRPTAPAQSSDDSIREAVRERLSPAIDVRVRDGVVALRGTASPAERDRALTHALSIPGVRRVYSDLEDGRSILETGAAKMGLAHPR